MDETTKPDTPVTLTPSKSPFGAKHILASIAVVLLVLVLVIATINRNKIELPLAKSVEEIVTPTSKPIPTELRVAVFQEKGEYIFVDIDTSKELVRIKLPEDAESCVLLDKNPHKTLFNCNGDLYDYTSSIVGQTFPVTAVVSPDDKYEVSDLPIFDDRESYQISNLEDESTKVFTNTTFGAKPFSPIQTYPNTAKFIKFISNTQLLFTYIGSTSDTHAYIMDVESLRSEKITGDLPTFRYKISSSGDIYSYFDEENKLEHIDISSQAKSSYDLNTEIELHDITDEDGVNLIETISPDGRFAVLRSYNSFCNTENEYDSSTGCPSKDKTKYNKLHIFDKEKGSIIHNVNMGKHEGYYGHIWYPQFVNNRLYFGLAYAYNISLHYIDLKTGEIADIFSTEVDSEYPLGAAYKEYTSDYFDI